MTKKERQQFDLIKMEEISRALKGLEESDFQTFKRVFRNVSKYTPYWSEIKVGNKRGMVCILKGSNGGVVSSSIAWLAPKDKFNPDIGKRISYSRAIRYLVAKRFGVTS